MTFVKAVLAAAAVLGAGAGPAIAGPAVAVPAAAVIRPAEAKPVPFSTLTVYAVGPDDSYVEEWNGTANSWTTIGGPAKRVYAGSAGVFATNPTTGYIYRYNGTPGSWTQIGGPGGEFVEGGGHLYAIGPNEAYVAEYNGTPGSWSIIRNQKTGRLYAGDFGLFAMDDDGDFDLIHYNGTPGSWTNIDSGAVLYAGVTDNALYAVNSAQAVLRWTPATGWVPIGPPHPGDLIEDLTAGGAGVVVSDGSQPSEELYGNTPYQWTAISTSPELVTDAVGPKYIYGLDYSTGNQNVVVYSGTGTQWTTIGFAVSPPLAAAG